MEPNNELFEEYKRKHREYLRSKLEFETAERRVFSKLKEQDPVKDPKHDKEQTKEKQGMVCFPSEEEARRKLCPCKDERPPKEIDEDPEEEDTSEDVEEG